MRIILTHAEIEQQVARFPASTREHYEEHAGIKEYDGNMERQEAETKAFWATWDWLRKVDHQGGEG